MAEVASGGSTIDYVAMVDPYLMSACGRWFFFRMGKGPFGMVKLFPDTKNAGLAAVRVNRRLADAFDHDFTEISYVYWRDAKEA